VVAFAGAIPGRVRLLRLAGWSSKRYRSRATIVIIGFNSKKNALFRGLASTKDFGTSVRVLSGWGREN